MKWNRVAEIEVRVGEINYGGHLGNDKALLMFHDARLKLLHSLDLSEHNIGEGRGIIMTEAHVFFRKEVFLYDRLYVDIETGLIDDRSFELIYHIYRESDGKKVIQGTTKQYAFDYDSRKTALLPDEFRRSLINET
jgi:acyl-CoA thioester hydrolase